MEVQKFPIYSESGVEYLVKIEDNSYIANHFDVRLYLPYQTKILKRYNWNMIWDITCDGATNEKDLVAMAKKQVKKYEKTIFDQREHDRVIAEKVKEFEDWDGKVSSD